MKNYFITLIALFVTILTTAQIDRSVGHQSTGLTTAELNALPLSIKTGLTILDTTLGYVVTWNGSEFVAAGSSSSGDMAKSTYDTDDDGLVDGVEQTAITTAYPNIDTDGSGTAVQATAPITLSGTGTVGSPYQVGLNDAAYMLLDGSRALTGDIQADHNGINDLNYIDWFNGPSDPNKIMRVLINNGVSDEFWLAPSLVGGGSWLSTFKYDYTGNVWEIDDNEILTTANLSSQPGGTDNQTLAEVLAEGADANDVTISNFGSITFSTNNRIFGSTTNPLGGLYVRPVYFQPTNPATKSFKVTQNNSADHLYFEMESSAGAGDHSVVASISDTSVPVLATDLVRKDYADANYGGGTPDDDSVTPAKMADGDFGDFTITANLAFLDANVVTSTQIANDAVSSAKIADNAVTETQIAAGSVGTSEIADGTIQEVDLEVTNAPTDDYQLTYDSATGGFTWVELRDISDEEFTADYTPTTSDLYKIKEGNNANALTISEPTGTYSDGNYITLQQTGVGQLECDFVDWVSGSNIRTSGIGDQITIRYKSTARNGSSWAFSGGGESYTPDPINQITGLVERWDADKSATASGNPETDLTGEIASYVMNVLGDPQVASDASGKYWVYDGTGDAHVNTNNDAALNLSPTTTGSIVVVTGPTVPTSSGTWFVNKGDSSGAAGTQYGIGVLDADSQRTYIGGEVKNHNLTPSTANKVIAATWDGTNIQFYVDTTSYDPDTYTGTFTTTEKLAFAARLSGTSQNSIVDIREVLVFNTEITTTDLQTIIDNHANSN